MAKTRDKRIPSDPSAKDKAEGDRRESDSETVERYDKTIGGGERAGISNSGVERERENPVLLPERGNRKEEDEP